MRALAAYNYSRRVRAASQDHQHASKAARGSGDSELFMARTANHGLKPALSVGRFSDAVSPKIADAAACASLASLPVDALGL